MTRRSPSPPHCASARSATPPSARCGSWGCGRGCGCCRTTGPPPSGTPARCSRQGSSPSGRLWPRLVLGLLAARRDAPPENPDLDELWCLADRLDNLGKIAPAAVALAEQAWILRRPDPRLADPPGSPPSSKRTSPHGGPGTLRAWARRLARRGAAGARPGRSTGRWPPPSRPLRAGPRALGRRLRRRPCSRRSRCWTTWARAPSARCSAAGCASWA